MESSARVNYIYPYITVSIERFLDFIHCPQTEYYAVQAEAVPVFRLKVSIQLGQLKRDNSTIVQM
jgi:hypothetical protein